MIMSKLAEQMPKYLTLTVKINCFKVIFSLKFEGVTECLEYSAFAMSYLYRRLPCRSCKHMRIKWCAFGEYYTQENGAYPLFAPFF